MIKSEETGLVEPVRASAEILLEDIVPLWLDEQPLDWKRVVRPEGVGSFSINIEPYRGVQTRIAFERKLEGRASLKQFECAVEKYQPELTGYVSWPGRAQRVGHVATLTICWCQMAEKYFEEGVTSRVAIEKVLNELNAVLASRRMRQQVRTPLSGLTLPEGVDRIDLHDGFSIRRLSVKEISDLGSHDVTSGMQHDIVSLSVSTAAFIEEAMPIQLTSGYSEPKPQSDLQKRNQDQLNTLLSALHVVKTGRVSVIASFFDIEPLVLPIGGHSSAPLVRHPFASMNLADDDIKRLFEVFSRLVASQRDEVRIACVRLMDAEHRMSPVDSLLDAVIGLEALLNPNDTSELAFRVALNYAFLGMVKDRRVRFERIRDIQKVRNRVVHGGLNLRSKEAPLIHEQATVAKACLRDAIQAFLFDESLSGNRKLDMEFWLDRVLPSNVSVAIGLSE